MTPVLVVRTGFGSVTHMGDLPGRGVRGALPGGERPRQDVLAGPALRRPLGLLRLWLTDRSAHTQRSDRGSDEVPLPAGYVDGGVIPTPLSIRRRSTTCCSSIS